MSRPGAAAGILAGVVATLLASGLAGAATQREWVFTQRMTLNDVSSTHCYDRRSLRKEGTVIRVWVRSNVAKHILADGCQSLTGGADGTTFESEILIRCNDSRWVQTVDSRGRRNPEPPAEDKWRDARTGEYRNMVVSICAAASRLPDLGSAIYGNATAKGNATSSSAAPGAGSNMPRRTETARTVPPGDVAGRRESAIKPSSGTGFFVDGNGHVLTNHHVAGSCRQVTVVLDGKRLRAEVIARDAALDLALLKTGATTTAYASFRTAAPPRAGETVTAVGFPLRGLLASGPIVSTGIVNAVAGIRDDTTRFQISAPVQPGNSGGPVVDAGANVIGVVVSKLDAIKLAQATGDIPQNINFAVKGDMARKFLEANKISPRTGTWTRPIDSVGVAAIAKSMTVPVECQ